MYMGIGSYVLMVTEKGDANKWIEPRIVEKASSNCRLILEILVVKPEIRRRTQGQVNNNEGMEWEKPSYPYSGQNSEKLTLSLLRL